MPKSSNSVTGGRQVVEALLAHGVGAVFCVPGESYLEILDALHDATDNIRLVTCRHENGAANMAEAYAKLTGRVGVCMVSRGPGACNAAIGIHTAFQDSTPVLLLIGQVPRPYRGREAFQEVDFEAMFSPLAKWVGEVKEAGRVAEMVAGAISDAISGRPGPSILSLPEDILSQSMPTATCPAAKVPKASHVCPSSSDIKHLRRMLADSRRPMMLLGGGGWTDKARQDILSFAELNHLPVSCSFRRHDLFDNRNACFVGEMGISPDPALVKRFKDADLLLVVGARLGEMTTQGYTLIDPERNQPMIHVHPDPDEPGRVFRAELGINSSMPDFAEAVASMIPLDDPGWFEWSREARIDYQKNRIPVAPPGPLDLAKVMADIDMWLPDDAIITVDAGNFSGWPQRYLTFGGGRRLLGAANGAMGYGVPAAVAAKIIEPERVVVGFVGDGGFAMTGMEMATAVHNGAAPLIIVFNNSIFGTIRMHQERRYPGRVTGTDLAHIDIAATARSLGAFAERVEKTGDFLPALRRAAKSGRAAVIELIVDTDVISTRTTLSEIRSAALDRP